MKLFLQIEIGNRQPNHDGIQWLHFASSLSSDLIGTEIGTGSDPDVIETVLQLIMQTEKVFLLVNINDSLASAGSLSEIINQLVNDQERSVTAIIRGGRHSIEEMLSGHGEKVTRVNSDHPIQDLIKKFAQ
jgi:hypothetical protein